MTIDNSAEVKPLKPCPFCGAAAIVIENRIIGWVKAECIKCHGGVGCVLGTDDVCELWNRRYVDEQCEQAARKEGFEAGVIEALRVVGRPAGWSKLISFADYQKQKE